MLAQHPPHLEGAELRQGTAAPGHHPAPGQHPLSTLPPPPGTHCCLEAEEGSLEVGEAQPLCLQLGVQCQEVPVELVLAGALDVALQAAQQLGEMLRAQPRTRQALEGGKGCSQGLPPCPPSARLPCRPPHPRRPAPTWLSSRAAMMPGASAVRTWCSVARRLLSFRRRNASPLPSGEDERRLWSELAESWAVLVGGGEGWHCPMSPPTPASGISACGPGVGTATGLGRGDGGPPASPPTCNGGVQCPGIREHGGVQCWDMAGGAGVRGGRKPTPPLPGSLPGSLLHPRVWDVLPQVAVAGGCLARVAQERGAARCAPHRGVLPG